MIASQAGLPQPGGTMPREVHRRGLRHAARASEEDRLRLVAALLGLGSLLVWILFLQG